MLDIVKSDTYHTASLSQIKCISILVRKAERLLTASPSRNPNH